MGAFLGVARAVAPPKFIIMEHEPRVRGARVLVTKATFDTGVSPAG
jgi:leucyl aminopeptidase